MPYKRTQLRAYTYKEGLLSRVGHDLVHELRSFSLTIREQRIHAEFDTSSLHPLGAIAHGKLDTQALSAGELAEIRKTTQREVLHSDRHPQARFDGSYESRDGSFEVTGELELNGRRRPLAFQAREQEGRCSASSSCGPVNSVSRPIERCLERCACRTACESSFAWTGRSSTRRNREALRGDVTAADFEHQRARFSCGDARTERELFTGQQAHVVVVPERRQELVLSRKHAQAREKGDRARVVVELDLEL